MTVPEYQWYYGDGGVSTEKDPYHVYKMPGEYVVIRVRTVDGFEDIDTVTERVYDWYTNEGLHVAYTNKCIKSAVYSHQGVGLVERGGDNWVWPEAWVGTCHGFDKINNHISLVLDNASGNFYQIAIPEQWLDRLDTLSEYGQGGYEISSWMKLKEHVSTAGEYEDVRHEESYVYMRPFNESNRNLDEYSTETGMRGRFHVGAKLYTDGKLTHDAEINRVPLKADYVFREKVQSPRIQLEVNFSAAGWRCIGIQNKVEELDKKRGPLFNTKSETTWQREFLGQDLWMSRDSTNPVLNRASGNTISGTWDSLITGPDTIADSGVFFNATTGLSLTLPSLGESTLILWLRDVVVDSTLFTFGGGKSIGIELDGDEFDLVINNGIKTVNIPLSYKGDEWVMIAIRFASDGTRVIKNKTSLGIHNIVMGDYGGATTIMNGVIGSLFDVRRVPVVVTETGLEYYYNNVNSERGNNFLPVMR